MPVTTEPRPAMFDLYQLQYNGTVYEVYAVDAADALRHYGLTPDEVDWVRRA